MPQYHTFSLPALNNYTLLKFSGPTNLSDGQPADLPEDSSKYATDIKIKS